MSANEPLDEAARLAAIVASSDDAIISKTLDGVITSWNPGAERIFGYSASEAVGRPVTLIIPHERWAEEDYVLASIRRGERVEHFETVRVRKDGRRIDVSLTVSPLRNAAGVIVGASKIARDISERKRLEGAARVQREWFETALRSIGDAVIATDASGAVIFLNPVAEALTGWGSEGAAGRPLREVFPIVHETTRAAVESPVERVLREGVVVGLANHTILLRRDGSEVAIDDSAAPIRGNDGALAGVVLVFRDVSVKRREELRRAFLARATEELTASLDYPATLARLARLAVPELADWAAVDLVEEGRLRRVAVAHVDPAKVALVEEIVGRYPPDPNAPRGTPEILRTGKAQMVPDIPPAMIAATARDAEHLAMIERLGLRSYLGVPLRGRDGTFGVLTFALAESGRRFDEGDLAFALALADRASVAIENARLFREAERARRAAELASRAKDEFLAMLGHELRNPLAPILTALELIKLRGDDPHAHEHRVIERQARHMVRLVEDLLDVARITRGELTLSRRAVEVADVVAQAVETASALLEEHGHRLEVDVPRGLRVMGDPARLVQVVTNLLTNAAKYTEKGGHIAVRAARAEGCVELAVRDDGVGIAPEMQPRIFDLFVQTEQGLDRARGGLGLGLAIVKTLVALHGGAVAVTSEGIGKGAEFRVRLPALGDAPPEDDADVGPMRPARVQATRVLVVDDNEDAAEMLGEALRSFGHEVTVAYDGPAALGVATQQRPVIAVLDIGLPVMDGYELARRLRELPGLEHLKLVAVTGYGQTSDRERSRGAGFDAHLVKPIDLDELRDAVQRLIGQEGARTGGEPAPP